MVETEPLSAKIADSQGKVENHASGGTSKISFYLLFNVLADGAKDADKRENEEENDGCDNEPRKQRARAFASSEDINNTQFACLFTARLFL